ncbi:MAG: hypothetical protein M3P11_10785 [Actinomycetota bacterium]|nr:hypothetical protein [Actinomycetota bacterium]
MTQSFGGKVEDEVLDVAFLKWAHTHVADVYHAAKQCSDDPESRDLVATVLLFFKMNADDFEAWVKKVRTRT